VIAVNLDEAVSALRDGQLVIYPTETVYGIGADVQNAEAVAKLFRLKGRDPAKPVSVLISSLDDLASVVAEVTPRVCRLLDRFFPGPLTVVLPAASQLHAALHAGTGWIGIRQSSHPMAQALVKSFGAPITTTSANPSGEAGGYSVAQIRDYFSDEPDLFFLSGGDLAPSRGSTVVKAQGKELHLLRQGEIAFEKIAEVYG
jgi:L-threonylcarbamoyladenylate synthase